MNPDRIEKKSCALQEGSSVRSLMKKDYSQWRGGLPAWTQEITNGLNHSSRTDCLRFLNPQISSQLRETLRHSVESFDEASCLYVFGNPQTHESTNPNNREASFCHSLFVVNPERLKEENLLPKQFYHVTSSLVFPDHCVPIVPNRPFLSPTRVMRKNLNEYADFLGLMQSTENTGRVGPDLLRFFIPDAITLFGDRMAGYFYTDTAVWISPSINSEMWESCRHGTILSAQNSEQIQSAVSTICKHFIDWIEKGENSKTVIPEAAQALQTLGVFGFWQHQLSVPGIALNLIRQGPLARSRFGIEWFQDKLNRDIADRVAAESTSSQPLWRTKPFPLAFQVHYDPKTMLTLFSPRPATAIPLFAGIFVDQIEKIIVDPENIAATEEMLKKVFRDKNFWPIIPRPEIKETIDKCTLPYGDDPNDTLRYWADLLFSGDACFLLSSMGRLDSLEVFSSNRLSLQQQQAVRYGLFSIEVPSR